MKEGDEHRPNFRYPRPLRAQTILPFGSGCVAVKDRACAFVATAAPIDFTAGPRFTAHILTIGAGDSMSVDSIRAGGDFRVGDVLARTWNIYTGNILFFLGITFLTYVVIFVAVGLSIVPFAVAGMSASAGWLIIGVGVFLAVILFLSLNTIGEAVLLLGAFQRMRGEPLRVSEALRRAFSRFLPLIALGILWTLALMVGTLLFLIPGLMLLCAWWVVVPACVVENLGPLESMSRSAALTKGYRWKIFGLFLLVTIINAIGSKIVELVLGLGGDWLAGLGNIFWFVAWTGFWNCVLIMTYHDLRVAKEGVDTEQIAAIFD
jgi:hypothetical protein